MILPLKGEELMDGLDGRAVGGLNPQLRALGKRAGGVGDPGSPLAHDRGARHLAIVYEAGHSEVSPLKGKSYRPHVATNLGGSGRVEAVTLEGDPATIRKRLEPMRGSVLIHAHGLMASVLDQTEGAVGGISDAGMRRAS
jgi:hypothetical protein